MILTLDYLIDWCKERESSRPLFSFRHSIIDDELLVLSSVRSFYESDICTFQAVHNKHDTGFVLS